MPRCRKKRYCRKLDNKRMFIPVGKRGEELEKVVIRLDEFEAIRLCEMEGKSQIEASEAMEVSRATIQRLLQSGKKKLADALLNYKIIIIENE